MDDTIELSLILPAYNEEAGIAHAIAEADDALTRLGLVYEVIVVDDGSGDATAAVVTAAIHDRPSVRLVRHDVNRGYGAALRTGFVAARGQRVAFTDADCQFHLDDLALLLPLTETHPIAVGYRVDRKDPWLRKFYSRGYNLLARTLLGTTVRDIDCALKVFRRDALAKILPETRGFFVNTEMLTRARQHGLALAETGVRHRPRQRGESKVSVGDIPRVLNALLPFWWSRVLFAGANAIENEPRRQGIGMVGQLSLMVALLVMTCVLFLGRLDHALLEPEEARYAEIPRQMLQQGRFLTPVLHGEDYWQKPPLLYWLVMAGYKFFGVHDWSARLVPCLAGILTVMVSAAWGWRVLGFWPGFLGGVILSLSARFLYLAGMLSMDGLLCFFVVSGLACGHLALTDDRRRRAFLALAAIACALGVLTKGPVALVLVLVPLGAWAFLDRRGRLPSKVEGCAAFGLGAAIALPWFLFLALRAPGSASEFLWLHNLMRFVAPLDHEKPAWFFLPSLLLGMLPWSLLLAPMVPYLTRRSWRMSQRRPAVLGFFLLAFVWCVLFFSLSGCKRPGYILPGFPLLALALGTFVTHGLPWARWINVAAWRQAGTYRDARRLSRGLALTTTAMGLVLGMASAVSGFCTWGEAGLVLLGISAVGAAIVWLPARLPGWTTGTSCVVGVFLLLGLGQTVWLPDYHARFGLRRQTEIASEYEQDEQLPLLSYPKRYDSIGFYSGRRQVDSYTPAELARLVHDLQVHGKALVFVRRDGSLRELLGALPDHLEVEILSSRDEFVIVGIVRPRKD